MTFIPPGTPFKNLPDRTTPVRAEFLNSVVGELVSLRQGLTVLSEGAQTASIPSGDLQGVLEMAPAFRVISMTSDSADRLRLYRSEADRDADASRPYSTPPSVVGGVLAEFRWTSAEEFYSSGFIATLANVSDTTVYWLRDNAASIINIQWIREAY